LPDPTARRLRISRWSDAEARPNPWDTGIRHVPLSSPQYADVLDTSFAASMSRLTVLIRGVVLLRNGHL
jgi:hypothetical protein